MHGINHGEFNWIKVWWCQQDRILNTIVALHLLNTCSSCFCENLLVVLMMDISCSYNPFFPILSGVVMLLKLF